MPHQANILADSSLTHYKEHTWKFENVGVIEAYYKTFFTCVTFFKGFIFIAQMQGQLNFHIWFLTCLQ